MRLRYALLDTIRGYALLAWGYVVLRIVVNGVDFNTPFIDGLPGSILEVAVGTFVISAVATALWKWTDD